MKDGGYDTGYKTCQNFWGDSPGSLIIRLDSMINNYEGLKVLDLGCGEAKNSIYLAKKGCIVDAFDISEYAIANAETKLIGSLRINLAQSDVTRMNYFPNKYDLIISYGLFHCFENIKQVEEIITNCLCSMVKGGFFVLCAFNSRKHDLSAHPGFNPLLLNHCDYKAFFKDHIIVFESDENLFETHPHNNIPHMHSMTRLIIKKS